MEIVILAAGAGGMYCGSCMRDNTLAKALIRAGHSVSLVPLYSPLRTDEQDVSVGRVFYGGINSYLQYASRLFRWTPRFIDWLFDRKWILNLASKYGSQTSPARLGPFALSVLQGEHGPQIKELRRLIGYLKELRPEVVSLPTAMFLGMARMIRDELGAAVVCELTGEDIFLDALAEPYRSRAREIMRERSADVAGFIATSGYYADRMSEYLGVARERISVVYPGVGREMVGDGNFGFRIADCGLEGSNPKSEIRNPKSPTIAFLARICPEKGLDRLIDALALLRAMPGMDGVRVRAGGFLGLGHKGWFEGQQRRVAEMGLGEAFSYLGEVDRAGKMELLDSADVLCVPTAYAEPKGIFVLEALARGTPVVLPAHGSFPELVERTGGGVLVPPGNAEALARTLAELLGDPARRAAMGAAGRRAVAKGFTDDHMAAGAMGVYEAACASRERVAVG